MWCKKPFIDHKSGVIKHKGGAACMFFGQHNHSVDKKGRVFVPAKYREELGQEFMLSRSPDGKRCLCVYPIGEWQKIDEKLKSLPAVQAGKLVRFMYSGAELSTCDSQSRVLIPQNLREYADLKGDAAIIGMSSKLEIWDSEAFKAEQAEETPESIAQLAELLGF